MEFESRQVAESWGPNPFTALGGDPGYRSPLSFRLEQNYPNPFNPATTIEYDLGKPVQVKLEIFNNLGQKVRTLVNRKETTGPKTVAWDGTSDEGESLPTGTYFYRLVAGDKVLAKKMLLLK